MNAVDLFCGCGGLSLGLEQSGIDIIASYENWEPAINIYKQNFTHPVNQFDLNDVNGAVKHISSYNPNMIVGGPPCQDFSSAGKRNEQGSRGNLTLSYAEIVASVKPEWFIMENVARIEKTTIFQQAKEILSNAGYGFTEIILDASKCGVPQVRKRLFLIGKLGEQPDFLKEYIEEKLTLKSLTVGEYLGPTLDTQYYYRHARSYSRRGIFSIDEPSPTIRGVNRPIPPDYKIHSGDATKILSNVRPLTTTERAAIQTFPNKFKWNNTAKSVLEQIIGNAVPVNLAKFVGNAVMRYVKDSHASNLQTRLKTDKQIKLFTSSSVSSF